MLNTAMDVLYACFIGWLILNTPYGYNNDISRGGIAALTDQAVMNYIAKYGQVNVSVVDNLNKVDNYVTMSFKLTNTGSRWIEAGHWRIYYYALYGVGSRGEILNCGLRVCPIDKGLFFFTPVEDLFPAISPGETLDCIYHNQKWSVARTDQMPNWYVTSGSAVPEVIESTKGERLSFVGPIDTPAKWKRGEGDKYNPYTLEERYAMNEVFRNITKGVRVIPTPLDISVKNNMVLICSAENGWVVVKSKEFNFESRFLADMIQLSTVLSIPPAKYIRYVSENVSNDTDSESYVLDIDSEANVITIIAGDGRGAMHATQTLISLLESDDRKLPKIIIKDRPRFPYRGVMLDTARNFKPKPWVLKLLDAISMYKLNVLHLHLTDDEGWRIEIPALPELTQVGSQRCHSTNDLCLIPNLGSGPTNSTHGSGFYSVNDYRDILKYAADRHITIIPEVDMPGHSTAAISAMGFRESKLRSEKVIHNETESYLLNDITSDQSKCQETFQRFNAINPCLNSTYRFVEKVVDGLMWLHSNIMPLTLLHVGGDEVADGVWDLSPACQQFAENGKISTRRLHRLFLRKVSDIMSSRGLTIGVWDDGVYTDGKPDDLNDFQTSVHVYPWDNTWETGQAKRAYQFAESGYKVVLSLATHLYFSHTYEPDPEERGVSWATRVVDTKKVFGMMPSDIYSNADVTSMGDAINLQKMCQNEQCPRTSKPDNVIGLQACLWSETIRTEDQVHYMLFPKLLALAERSWHKAPWEDIDDLNTRDSKREYDWSIFVNELGVKELPRLERRDIQYRVPPSGASVEGDFLMVNTQYPDHLVEVSMDDGATWSVAMEKVQLLPGLHDVHLRSRTPILRRTSRVLKFQAHITSSACTSGVSVIASVFVISLVTFM